MITRRKLNDKAYAKKFVMGFFTISVAAAAVYALSVNNKHPEDLLAKFYQLLSYKEF